MSDRDTITVPADLAELDDEALSGLTDSLTAEFDGLIDDGSRDVARLTALADDIDRLRGERTTRDTAAEQDDQAIAALAARVGGEPAADEPTEEIPVVETTEGEPVLASHTHSMSAPAPARPALSDLARRTQRPRVPARRAPGVTITAAADLPGLSPGVNIGVLQMAESFHDRARNLSMGQRAPVARVEVPHTHFLTNDPEANLLAIDDLVGTPKADALVASGGWCAPSEPLFELFDIGPDTDNLFDLPSLGSKVRAGVMLPSFYGIGDAAGALWTWTEANDIDAADNNGTGDVTKPCLKIPCPTWSECRLEAEGLCVTHGNLSDRAWPELTKQFLSIVMGAHLRRVSAAKIAKVLADAPAATAPGAGMTAGDAASDLLGIVELAAADMRSQYRIGKGRSIDVLFPDWILAVLRSNMAQRSGVALLDVKDSQITSWLTQRGVRPQFTPDWQPIHPVGNAAAAGWPANVTFAMWLTGSYVSIDGGSIDLGVLRDSALNATNDFTAAWSEQFYQVCRRGPQGRQYTVALTPDGVVGCCPVA